MHMHTHTHTHTPCAAEVGVPQTSPLSIHAFLQGQEREGTQEAPHDDLKGGHRQTLQKMEEYGRGRKGIIYDTVLHDVMVICEWRGQRSP